METHNSRFMAFVAEDSGFLGLPYPIISLLMVLGFRVQVVQFSTAHTDLMAAGNSGHSTAVLIQRKLQYEFMCGHTTPSPPTLDSANTLQGFVFGTSIASTGSQRRSYCLGFLAVDTEAPRQDRVPRPCYTSFVGYNIIILFQQPEELHRSPWVERTISKILSSMLIEFSPQGRLREMCTSREGLNREGWVDCSI